MSAETDTPSVAEETTRDMSHQFSRRVTALVNIYKHDIGIYKRSKGDGAGMNRTLPEGVNIQFLQKNNTYVYKIYKIEKFTDCSFLWLMVFKIDNNNIHTHVHIELTYLPGKLESNYIPIDDSSQDWIATRRKHIKLNNLINTAGIFYGPDKTYFLLGGPNIYVNIKMLLQYAVSIQLKIFFTNLINITSKVSKYMYALYAIYSIYIKKNDLVEPLIKYFKKNKINNVIAQYEYKNTAKVTIDNAVLELFEKDKLLYDYIFTYALIFPYDHNGSGYTKIKWLMDIVKDMSSSENSKCSMFNDIALDYVNRYSGPYGTYPRNVNYIPKDEPLDKMYDASMSALSSISSYYEKPLKLFGSMPLNANFISFMR